MAQQKNLFSSPTSAKCKIWFEVNGKHIFGSGVAKLLLNIQRSGSLRQAAKLSKMSYRYAWDLIRNAELHLGRKLVIKHSGGSGGGGSMLSDQGIKMLKTFDLLQEEVTAFSNERFARLFLQEDTVG